MSALARLLVDRITASGPITFAQYQTEALYHPIYGYYAGAPRTGRAGHFLTSAELDPAFGALWTRGFELVWDACGRPATFDVVEIGPGEGGFAAAVLDAAGGDFGNALAYRLVERVPAAAQRQIERLGARPDVTWSPSLEEVSPVACGCVWANEVLDNQPVHLLERRKGRVVELVVGVEGRRLALVAAAPSGSASGALARSGLALAEGQRVELSPAAAELAAAAAGRVRRGAVIFVDYGLTTEQRSLRPLGTLVAYSGAGADELVFDRVGRKDITSHADWTLISRTLAEVGCAVTGPVPQRDLLVALGLGELHQRLRSEHQAALDAGRGADAVRALSRRQALGVLSDPGGLGSLEVLAGFKGLQAPAFVSQAGPTPR